MFCEMILLGIFYLLATAVTVWQMYIIFNTFYSYDVTVKLYMTSKDTLVFPAVTLCNVNAVRYVLNTIIAQRPHADVNIYTAGLSDRMRVSTIVCFMVVS